MLQAAALATWLTDPVYLDNSLWQWGTLLAAIIGALVVGKLASFLLIRHADHLAARPGWEGLETTLRATQRPVIMLLIVLAAYLSRHAMELTYRFDPNTPDPGTTLQDVWLRAVSIAMYLAIAWLIYRMVDVVEHYLRKWTAKTETTFDDQLVPLVRKATRVFVVIVAILFIIQNVFRADIGALLAGLGLGGLAFALAAKDTIANLFGSITIFADQPFRIGERIVVQGQDGAVEEVGFRSTKIRTLTGHLVTIPNGILANETVENIGRRPFIRRLMNVTITYDTSPDKVQRAVGIIKEMLAARIEHFPEDFPPRVFFNDFNDMSLNILVLYWFAPPDYWAYQEFSEAFNMELLERFNDEGIEFAFPTQTLHVKKDADAPPQLDGPLAPSDQPRVTT